MAIRSWSNLVFSQAAPGGRQLWPLTEMSHRLKKENLRFASLKVQRKISPPFMYSVYILVELMYVSSGCPNIPQKIKEEEGEATLSEQLYIEISIKFSFAHQ